MELNAQLLALQSTLRNVEKSTQTFSIIKYKSGNEENINKIVDAIKSHIRQHKESAYKNKFLLLLILNTNLENNTLRNIKEYQHLINLIPSLSTCLLANIIVELDFADAYASIVTTISLQDNKEILLELEISLKQSEVSKTLKDTYIVLNTVIDLFPSSNQNNEIINRIMDIFIEMLKNLVKVHLDKVQNWTLVRLQEHIGYTLLHVLKLLNKCDIGIEKLTDALINSAITIQKAVTLNMFCIWAEVQYNDDGTPLQLIIAEEAYMAIERLQNYKPAKTLVEMLNTIAKKPKTLVEKIREADLKTIIANVNRNKENQLLWFRALINTDVFNNTDAINCLNNWHNLCTPDDVSRLFCLKASSNDRSLILKCASTLDVDDLKSVIVKYFWKNMIDWDVNINNELILLFNKMQNDNEIDQNLLKQIFLLLIQNRKMFLRTLYMNCLNTAANVRNFKNVFDNIKDIIAINSVAKSIFVEVFQDNFVSDENVMAFKELINVLIDLKYLSHTFVICDVFQPQLGKLYENGAFTSLYSTLKVLNIISVEFVLDNETFPFLVFLLELTENYRKWFLTFLQHHHIVQECVSLISKFEDNGPYPFFKDQFKTLRLCPINRFYTRKLYGKSDKILKYLFGSWNVKETAEWVAMLIKVLPLSVKTEWIFIINEIELECDYEATLKLLNKVLFLLCQVTNSQEGVDEQDNLLVFCLNQYLIVIKELLQPKHSSLKEETILAKCICALLKDLPSNVRQKESMRIVGLLSNHVLKSLKDDHEFVLSLIAIQDINVSQLLAQRIMSS